jgi:Zn-dependent protease
MVSKAASKKCMKKSLLLVQWLLLSSPCYLALIKICWGFNPPKTLTRSTIHVVGGSMSRRYPSSIHPIGIGRSCKLLQLSLFRRWFGGEEDPDGKKDKTDDIPKQEQQAAESEALKKLSSTPFFASVESPPNPLESKVNDGEETLDTAATTNVAVEQKPLTPQEEAIRKAEAMKREAAKFRMEAERMDILLSLDKISALEKKLEMAKKSKDEKLVQQVEDEIAVLRRKLDPTSNPPPLRKKDIDSNSLLSNSAKPSLFSTRTNAQDKNLEKLLDEPSNKFMRDLVAKSVGLEASANTTVLLQKMQKVEGNNTVLLSEEVGDFMGLTDDFIESVAAEMEDATIANAFPKSMWFVDSTEDKLIAENDAMIFRNQVLSSSTFIPSEKKPQKTSVGYIIRGTNRMGDGDKLIDALDDALQKKAPYLKERISFYYVEDPVPVEINDISTDIPTKPEDFVRLMLLVTNADIQAGTEQRIARLITTGIGIGSIYFFSIYPFTFNEMINRKVDSIITLGQGGPQDLAFLTDLSEPLFYSFLGIVAFHELGHLAVATAYKFKTSFPTLVPSPAIGLTSSITRFKSSPKNRQQLLDFALAGPWAGIVSSMIALLVGLQLTASMDAASFAQLPALPTAFLQASTLISSIIDNYLDNGLMQAPDPTLPIPLHPAAIAGYAGLMYNALNLVPYGSK